MTNIDFREHNPTNKVFFEQPGSTLDTLNLSRILFEEGEYVDCASILKIYCVVCEDPDQRQEDNHFQ